MSWQHTAIPFIARNASRRRHRTRRTAKVRINWNGKRRWLALILVILSIVLMLKLPPVIPVIQLPGEVWPNAQILGLPITNTLAGSFIVWILILLLCLYVSRARPKSDSEAPRGGFYNFFELAYEGLYGFVQGIAGGPYMRTIFSFFMTIFIIVLLSNWLELIPGVDSVGFLEPHVEKNATSGQVEAKNGYEPLQAGPFYYLNPQCTWVSPEAAKALSAEVKASRAAKGCVTGTTTATTASQNASPTPGDPSVPWVVLPFVRVPSTDLNMTLALALIAVVTIQAMGVRALGPGYFNKFLPVKKLITNATGGMD